MTISFDQTAHDRQVAKAQRNLARQARPVRTGWVALLLGR